MTTIFGVLAMLITIQAQAGIPGWQTQCSVKGEDNGWLTIHWGEFKKQENKEWWNKSAFQAAEVSGFVDGQEVSDSVIFQHSSQSTRCGEEVSAHAVLASGAKIWHFAKAFISQGCGGDQNTWTYGIPGKHGKYVKLSCFDKAQ